MSLLRKKKNKHPTHGHDHVWPGHTVTSVAVQAMPCRTSVMDKHQPRVCVRDPGQPAINKHHVSITHNLHVSCFLFVLRRRLPRCHGECLNNGEDTEQRRDAITEVKRGFFLSYVWQGSVPRVLCVCWALRNDRNAEPSALVLSGGWVVKSTVAGSFPGIGFSPVWACVCKRKEMQYAFPSVVFYLFLLCKTFLTVWLMIGFK